ncbi:hypothetical protein DFH27DRAFT_611895 [Peziza echinospora]|nr:hypothetical protein DFH27DRAFT_611895 [Peziza echinospora]
MPNSPHRHHHHHHPPLLPSIRARPYTQTSPAARSRKAGIVHKSTPYSQAFAPSPSAIAARTHTHSDTPTPPSPIPVIPSPAEGRQGAPTHSSTRTSLPTPPPSSSATPPKGTLCWFQQLVLATPYAPNTTATPPPSPHPPNHRNHHHRPLPALTYLASTPQTNPEENTTTPSTQTPPSNLSLSRASFRY